MSTHGFVYLVGKRVHAGRDMKNLHPHLSHDKVCLDSHTHSSYIYTCTYICNNNGQEELERE